MKLIINGNANRTFAETMCLIFFPGSKFPEIETDGDTPVCILDYKEEESGIACFAELSFGGRKESGDAFESYSDSVPRHRTGNKAIGNAIYKAGCALMGTPPPWGMLTGVRPAKLAEEYLKNGLANSELTKALIKDYHLSERKAELLSKITDIEMKAFSLAKEDTCSLYISIPFCPTKCAYCSFVSYSTKGLLSLIPDYLEMLCDEIDTVCEKIREKGKRIITVYVGGGTPSILEPKQLERLLLTVERNVDVSSLLEYTVEAGRPDTITREKLDILAYHGVGRTSINPQTLDNRVLEKIGRRHTAEDFFKAYDMARSSGIKCINTDLIAGLPGDDHNGFRKTLDQIAELEPENVTVHSFTAKRAAEFVTDNKDGDVIYSYTGGDAGLSVDYSQEKLIEKGYDPYYIYRQKNTVGNLENVGFCKPGTEGLYNIFMMEELHDIYAAGAGAVTKIIHGEGGRIERIFNPKYPYEYLKRSEK